ncbi:MAG: acyltransferase [Rhodospirillales bacterium]|nr:acyltransferase [Rhodospirillales bacterium]
MPPPYSAYVIRRVCRIYIPFLVTIVLAGALWLIAAAPDLTRAPYGGDWSHPVDAGVFLSHILMSGLTDGNVLNPPIWTLIIEMRVSLIFPLLVILMTRFSWGGLLGSFILGFVAAKIFSRFDGSYNFYMAETVTGALLLTVYYIPFFLLGIMIASRMELLKTWMARVPYGIHLVVVALIFLTPHGWLNNHFTIVELWYGGAAVYFVLCCISFERVDRVLLTPALQWLGKVSYSLYLVHLPVMLTILYLFGDKIPVPVTLLLALPVILGAADIFNRFVEMPAMRLGKKITKSASTPLK